MPTSPNPKVSMSELSQLEAQLQGELLWDPLHRMLYATDASLYAEEPIGVAYPANTQDLVTLVKWAAQLKVPLIPRAAGTSLAGQCVGNGLVVDISKHMTAILELDVENRRVRVQPGVILDELNRTLAPHGLMFGPDTSTSNRCMIGGMMGNNSCGSHSIRYGTTLDHVLSAQFVLSDGSLVVWGDQDAQAQRASAAADSLEGRIQTQLHAAVSNHLDEIRARFPKPEVLRRNMGYPLDFLASTELFSEAGQPWNLARFLCGTEGTLALTAEATLNLVPTPKFKGLVASHFDALDEALRAAVIAVDHEPAAVELLDRRVLEATRDNIEQERNRGWLVGDPEAVLLIEFYRDSPQAITRDSEALVKALEKSGLGTAHLHLDAKEMLKAWALRKAGLGLLMGIRGDLKPVTIVEDTAVAVADLPEYIRRFAKILEKHDTKCVYYAHASVGLLHLRPELNPKKRQDVEKMKRIAREVAELVREFRGTLSGEHGDGRLRSPLIEMMLGTEITKVMQQLKDCFDPAGILNPKKILDPLPMDADLRFLPDRRVDAPRTFFSYSEDGDLLRAVERCNGAGACRKLATAGGTMCPSYMATRDEKHTTRGRSNVFRSLLLGEDPNRTWTSDALDQALELCLACKGCKSECPASVDMAKLKSEFLQQRFDRLGTPLANRGLGSPELGYEWAQRFGRLSNWGTRTWLGRKLLSAAFGVDPRRDLPNFARRTLRQQLASRTFQNLESDKEVVLFVDLFTDYNEPELGLMALEVLELLGYHVLVVEHPTAGRPQLSKGLLREARQIAQENVEIFYPFAARGVPIVGIEPSEILTLLDEYPDLVSKDLREKAQTVAKHVALVDAFVGSLLQHSNEKKGRVHLHGHCHQKTLVGNAPVVEALTRAGYEVVSIPSGCCGMAGSFGFQHHDLSMEIGELVLFPAVRMSAAQDFVAAPGTSCRHQIKDGTGRMALHPIELLHRALVG